MLSENIKSIFANRTSSERLPPSLFRESDKILPVTMSGYRKNSFVIDFSVMPIRPKLNVVQDFVFTKMKLDMNLVKNLQTSITKSQVIIEVDSAATAENIVAQHSLKHSLEHDKQLYPIPVHPADNAIEVKVYDLPPHMPNQLIASHFAAFGKVISVRNDVWKEYFPGIPNGVRIVRMEVQRPIPSYVPVSGELSYVLHVNQVKTCRHCAQKIHIGKSCAAARKVATARSGATPTLAEIVGNTQDADDENELHVDPMEVAESEDEADIVEPTPDQEKKEPVKSKSKPVTETVPEQVTGPSTSIAAMPAAAESDTESDPLGGRKRQLSPKNSEQESHRQSRRSKSRRRQPSK